MRRRLPPTLPDRFGVFTAAEAASMGWTPSALRSAVSYQHLVRLCRGAYVDAELWNATGPDLDHRRLTMRTVAALLTVATSAASHTSSAVLADLPVWDVPERPCLTVRPKYTGDSRAAHLHRATFSPQLLVPNSPHRRLTTARTVTDIAREHGAEDAIVVGDCALRRGTIDMRQLVAVVEDCSRWPGIRRAVDVLRLLDGRSESPLESVSRVRMAARRIPQPALQPNVYDLRGRFLGRLDFYWDEFGVAGEVDGTVKYVDDPVRALLLEKRRQARMEDAGLIFTRWGRSDVENMGLLHAQLRRAFARGARRPRSDREYVIELAEPIGRDFAPRTCAG